MNRLSGILGYVAVGALLVTPLVLFAKVASEARLPTSLWLAVLGVVLATWSIATELAPYAMRAFHELSAAWIHRLSACLTLSGAGLTLGSFWQAAKGKPEDWKLEEIPLGGTLMVWLVMLIIAVLLTVVAAAIRQPAGSGTPEASGGAN